VLQKEITTLRDTSRALTLKLRDIEVANDDFEKQARHQTSSLEDMESKYNKAIERGVLLDEEIRNGDQEREALRIETQRLRDELSDLKVEADITHEKLRLAEESWALNGLRKPSGGHGVSVITEGLRSQSPPLSESGASTTATTISSPTVATPPPKSDTSTVQTSPPSPPLSEASAVVLTTKLAPPVTPANRRVLEPGTTPRPLHSGIRPPRHSRGPSIPTATSAVRQQGPTSAAPKRTTTRPSIGGGGRPSLSGLPQPTTSKAMGHIHSLRTKMQTLEQRVQRAHSKLPAPTTTPPRASPRSDRDIPSSVTVRSSRKRPSASVSTTNTNDGPASRLSFGFNPSASVSAAGGDSRPSSRASISGVPRPSSRASGIAVARPPSQTGMRTPSSLGYYPTTSDRRPRSSLSGSYAAAQTQASSSSRAGTPAGSRHGYSSSVSMSMSMGMSSNQNSQNTDDSLLEEEGDVDGGVTPTAARRTSTIPTPSMGRRQSAATLVRRQSNISIGDAGGGGGGGMLPPASTARRDRRTGVDIGETF